MAVVIINHQVKDYDAWRPFFDRDISRRKEAGITSEEVYCSKEDPNNLYLIFKTNDVAKFEAMFQNPDLRAVMEEAGVISDSKATILEEAHYLEHA